MNADEFKAEIKRRNWRGPHITETCCLCGGNEWRFANAQVILGNLYIATSCATCPPVGGPLIGPYRLEERE